MPKPRLPYLHHETTRHGARVWYVRKGRGPRVRIKATYDSKRFWEEYRAALADAARPDRSPAVLTLEKALDRYRGSSAWAGLSVATRRQRENIFHGVIAKAGGEPLTSITTKVNRAKRTIHRV